MVLRAVELGTSVKGIAASIGGYLEIYARARAYVGNRVHGAIVLAGRAACATAIGWDTRLLAASDVGARITRPSWIEPDRFREIAAAEPGLGDALRIDLVRRERARMIALVRDFAEEPETKTTK